MRIIGIRELRQNASVYLRLVEAGETVRIESHGRPVALLIPVPEGGELARLAAAGRLSAAEADVLDLGPPLAPASGAALPSKALGKARKSER